MLKLGIYLIKKNNMKIVINDVILYWNKSKLELMHFDDNDKKEWKTLFLNFLSLTNWLKKYWARWPNLPEWLSETAFCLASWSKRFIKLISWNNSSSFDTFNIETNEAEQIKATSIEFDLTSFWPDSKRDIIYFMDFHNNWNIDWTFDVYKIDGSIIKKIILNKKKNETFEDQQKQWRRPRLSIKRSIIIPNNIKPIYKSIKF